MRLKMIIDIIIIVLIILSTFLGYKKGLVGVAFKILSFILALLVTLILFKPGSNYIINNTKIDETIQSAIIEKLSGSKINDEGKIDKENAQIPEVMIDYINKSIDDTLNQTKDNITTQIAINLTQSSINIITMVALFIVTRLILFVISLVLNAMTELPIIKQVDEIGGTIYGILRAIVLIYIIFAILTFVLPMIQNDNIINTINNSIIARFMYNNNIILKVFFKS